MEIIKIDQIQNILSDIENRFFDIPFENSFFQDENFIINNEFSKTRQYRAIGLRLFNRINAIKNYQYEQAKKQIDIEEMTEKFETADKYEKRRIELELSKTKEDKKYSEKLLNDALNEASFLYLKLKEYPSYTREEFELAESEHFKEKFYRQAIGLTGALENLVNMGVDIDTFLKTNRQNLLERKE